VTSKRPSYQRGTSIFDSGCEALVNPVNCYGVMGAGLAREFKKKYPAMFSVYLHDCTHGLVTPGRVHIVLVPNSPLIINFPTKNHFSEKSKLSYIEDGLEDMVERLNDSDVKSVAIPALGGRLMWRDVEPLILEAAEKMKADVVIFPPQGLR